MKALSIKIILMILVSNMFMVNVVCAHHEKYKIALFVPRVDAFWQPLSNFMQAVCEDLSIECITYYARENHFKMLEQIKAIGSGPSKVDAVIFHGFKKSGSTFIKAAEEIKVKAFLINAGLEEDEYEVIGKPREKYKYWLGEMLPDDKRVGFDLANMLIDAAKSQGKIADDGKVHMFGISGIISDGASIERTKGLEQAVSQREDVKLYQIVPGNWEIDDAKEKFLGLMQRYPQSTVVWAANDARALGVLEGANKLGLIPGEDIFIGGIDWSGSGIAKVKDGQFVVDFGGHIMDAGWTVIMLYDYFHGIDFVSEGLQIKSKMIPITSTSTLASYNFFVDRNWGRIDFRKFSKKINPELREYGFNLEAILNQLSD